MYSQQSGLLTVHEDEDVELLAKHFVFTEQEIDNDRTRCNYELSENYDLVEN